VVINKYLAELVGTFILVLIGSMSILASQATGAPILVVVPFGFGLGLLAAIHAVGHVSGGHFNPAVTLAMWLDKRTSGSDVIGYLIAQFVGAIIASSVVLAVSSQDAVAGTANSFAPNGAGVGFVSEFVLTFIFVLVILASTKKSPSTAALAIPLTLVAIHQAGIPFSGASVNPARSFGPAVIGGSLSELWVYLVAPMAGGAIAWVFWRMFGGSEEA
jgi:aquaporin Z